MKKLLFIAALLLVSGGVAFAETNHFTANVSNVTDTKATLHGGANDCCDNWNATVVGPYYYFEYGTTTSVTQKTGEVTTLNWAEDTNAPLGTTSTTVNGLYPDTKYYYRFVQKVGSTNESGYTYSKSDLKSFKTLASNEEPDEDDENELTDAQIEGLEDLGFSDRQIKMIVALFAKKDHDGPQGLACGYRHKMLLRHGMFGDDVREVQKALKLNADGKFGRLTKEAVMRFQAEHGLHADGIIGSMTGLKLGLLCHSN